jgi:hypothetical protein
MLLPDFIQQFIVFIRADHALNLMLLEMFGTGDEKRIQIVDLERVGAFRTIVT